MKRLVALDRMTGHKKVLKIDGKNLLTEPCQGDEKATHVITYSHHDSHTHPMMFSIFFGALNPVMLNETTDKSEILQKLRERAKQPGPIVAYEYKSNTGLTADDLEEFKGYVLLVDSSFHSGVANKKLLAEILQRPTAELRGDIGSAGITEDYNFTALAILEESVQEQGLEAAVKWVKARIAEGTTTMEEKIILTETEWEIFKHASRRLRNELGYMPITAVYISHHLFKKNPMKYVLQGESLGTKIGVKWVTDGGFGSKTAALEIGTYTDGTKGHLTVPINHKDPKALENYIQMLRNYDVQDIACHAIGDRAIDIALELFVSFQLAEITMSIEHFELPLLQQIKRAAALGVPLRMQLNYATEVWRYAPWAGELVERVNPMRTILDLYDPDLITFGTDGMPQSMLWAMACGINHPIKEQRISLAEAIHHSKDPHGLIVIRNDTFNSLNTMDLKKAAENREASAAELHKGVELVIRDDIIL